MSKMASRGVPLRLAAVAAWLLAAAGPAGAGGALKISAVRTDGAYGDNTTMIFPNGRIAIVDGGNNSANANKLTAYLDSIVGAGGTIWYMCMSHPHTDHYYGLEAALNQYVVMRYYSSFPENDVPAQTSANNATYATYTGLLNTEFSTPYTTNVNCYEVIATANPATTPKVSGASPTLGPGWDPNVDAMVTSGEEMSSNAASNSNSVEYHIWYGSNTYESGGDMPGPAEADPEGTALTNYAGVGGRLRQNVTLAKMHHHGGNASNLANWLDPNSGITPANPLKRYSFACTGNVTDTANIFDTVGRNAAAGREMYRTDLDGVVRFAAIGDGNWSIVRQYLYSEGGTSNHNFVSAPPAAGTLSGAASGSAANLSWGSLAGATTYYVYRATVTGGIDIPFVAGEDPSSTYQRTGSVRGVYSRVAQVVSAGTTHQDAGLSAGSYYYCLKASDANGYESEYSNEVTVTIVGGGDTTPPAVPIGLSVADVPADQGGALQLNWTANTEPDLKDYRVRRSTGMGITAATAVLATVNAPGTTHQDGGLANGTTYYYRLAARDTSLNESAISGSDVGAYPVDNLAPAAAGGLAVGDPGTTALNLNWTANTETDLKDYRVYRSTNFGVTLVSSHVVVTLLSPGTTHQDGGLTAGTRYNYRLTARDNSANESAGSSEVSGVPGAPAAPAAPGAADVPADEGTALRLSWGMNTEADLKDYRLYRSTNGNVTVGSTWTITLATILQPGTTHQDAGLTPVTTYYYKVTARDASLNESGASGEVNLRPVDNSSPTAPGAAPTAADAPGDQGFALRLNWGLNSETDVREYRVYRSSNVGVTPVSSQAVAMIVSPGTTHQDGGLTNGTTFYYRFAARDTSGNESGLSPEGSAIPYDNTPPAVPTGFGLADPGTTALNLSWTANTEADLKDYGVYRATYSPVTVGAGASPAPTRITAPGTTHQDGTGVVGTRYYYRLTARDVSLNESGGATEVSGVPGAPAAPGGPGVTDVPSDQGSGLNLSWVANTEGDLKDYRLFRSTNGNVTVGSSWTITLATILQPGTTHQDTGLTPVTTYYYKVSARDGSLNESPASSEVNLRPVDNLAPAVPSGFSAGASTNAVNLSWAPNTESDLRDYRVWRSTNGGVTLVSSHTMAVVSAPGTTHQDGGLTNGTTYYFRLTARDGSGNESGGAVEISANPALGADTTPPAPPAGLGAADEPLDQGGRLRLSWTANAEPDLKDYRVYRSTFISPLGQKSLTTGVLAPGTTHADAGLNNGATYYYRLTARDTNSNESGGSAEASSFPADNLAPATPVGVGVADVPADQGFALRLSWIANTEADLKDYGVYRATYSPVVVGAGLAPARVSAPGTTHQDGGLTNGTTFYYRLTARDVSLNESGGASEISAVPYDNVAPAAPGGFGLGDPGTTVLNLNWTANTETDLKDYGVYRATYAGFSVGAASSPPVLVRVAAPGTTHQDGTGAVGTRYSYRITARDVSLNESGGSAELSGVPGVPAAPGGVGATDVPADQGFALRLSWTANTEADLKDYGVYRATYAGAGATAPLRVTFVTTAGTTHQDAGLANGTTYYYRLTARDLSLNESGGSTEVSAIPYDNVAPAAPGGFGLGDPGTTVLNLNWTANTETDLKDYGVYRATYTGAPVAPPTNVGRVATPGTTHQDGNVVVGTRYYYRITARDVSLNESGGSAELSGVPGVPAVPTGLGVADVPADQGTALRISWSADTEPDLKDYGVYRATFVGAGLQAGPVVRIATPGTTRQDGGLVPNATYYYRLTARDASLNESAGSAEGSAYPVDDLAPAPPTGAGVSNPGLGSRLSLSWTANTEADVKEYRIWRGLAAGSLVTKSVTNAVVAPGTTHQDGGLVNGTTYYYQVTARDSSLNESGESSEISGVPQDTTPPATPTGLGVADAGTGSGLNLSWTANTEADRKDYGVYRATYSGAGAAAPLRVAFAASPGTTHQDPGLSNGVTYYYRLTARDLSLNESGAAAERSAFPRDITPPLPVVGLGAADVPLDQGGQLRLSWTANTEGDLKDYRLWRSLVSGSIPDTKLNIAIILAPGTTYQNTGLVPGATYYYQVTARDLSLNESAESAEISAYPVDNLAPVPPTGFGIADPGVGLRLNLSWTDNTEPDRKDYRVWRGLTSGSLVTKSVMAVIVAPATTHQDAGLVNGTTYYYQMTIRDASLNESGGSVEVSGIPQDVTPPAPPGGVGVTNPNLGLRLDLSWTANTEADLKEYRVYRSTNNNVTVASTWTVLVAAVAAPGTTHQDGGLVNGTAYFYRLTARDATGNESTRSNEASATPSDTTAPAMPTGFGASDAPLDQGFALRLSWAANTEPDLKEYRLFRATVTGGIGTKGLVGVVATPGTTHQDGGLTNGTTYYYQITARDATLNESSPTGEISSIPYDNLAPAVPAGVGIADPGTTVLNLSWTAGTEADRKDYGVYRATYTGAPVAPPTNVARVAMPGTTHQDGNVVVGTLYYYRVTSRDVSLNESGGSSEVSGVPGAPAAPAGFVVTDPGTGQRLRLAWSANTEADMKDYGVYRATFVGAGLQAGPVVRVATPGTTHLDVGLTSGSTYYYRLTARDTSLNESPGSAELSSVPNRDTTPPGAITILSVVSGASSGQLFFNWTASGDDGVGGGAAAAYLVRVSTLPIVTAADFAAATPASFLTPVAPAAPGTVQAGTIGGLTPGTPYYVSIVAVDDALDVPGGNISPPSPNAAANRGTTAGTPPPPPPPPLPPDVKPGASVGIATSTFSLSGLGAVAGDTIQMRIVNKRTGATQVVEVQVDAAGTWSLTTPKLDDGTYNVQVRQVDPKGGASDWSPNPAITVTVDAVPKELSVAPAGPNPFRPGRGAAMSIGFDLNDTASVSVAIHATDGALVKTLMDDRQLAAGRYGNGPAASPAASWDGTNESGLSVASGIYLCRVKIGDRQFTRRILLIR